MEALKTKVLILPGINNSGPTHWQSLWEAENHDFVRVQQRDWDNPACGEWLTTLENSVEKAGADTILVAHSLACLLVAHWAVRTRLKIKGAFLVAPPNPDGINFPKEATGFSPLPTRSFTFASIVVVSSNDPYGSIDFARAAALAWGSRFVNIGAAGHISSNSGLAKWEEGFSLFQELAIK